MGKAFDESKAYAEQEETFFNDGREVELLHYVYSKDNIDEIRGSPKAVLAAIDDFGREKKYLMNVGEDKGRIVTNLIGEKKPKLMVELGGYVGYSCILFGDALRAAGGERYYSLEANPEFAAVILALVDLAGLSDFVKVVVGYSDVSLRRLHKNKTLSHIDMLFLDHYKPAYLPDLKLAEQLNLVGEGSTLVADNVVKPGNPPYLEYVRSSVADKKAKPQKSQASDGSSVVGNASLVYESRMVHSFEPTGIPDGVEITVCHGKQDG